MRSSIAIAVSAAAVASAQSGIAASDAPAIISSALGYASSQIATLPADQRSSALALLSSYVSILHEQQLTLDP